MYDTQYLSFKKNHPSHSLIKTLHAHFNGSDLTIAHTGPVQPVFNQFKMLFCPRPAARPSQVEPNFPPCPCSSSFTDFWTSWILKFWPLFRDWRKHSLWSPKVDAIHAKTTQSYVEGSFQRTGKLCKTQMDNCLNSRVSHLSNNKRLRS